MAPDPTAALRRQLVEQYAKAGSVKTPAVARAMARVPRHVFVPDYPLHLVYSDRALITKTRGGVPTSSSSQPGLMAAMLEMLRVKRGMNVLEVGAGTGYNAALLAELAGPDGAVTAVEIQTDVAAQARRNLRRAGYAGVRVARGDGARGSRASAPFDRIIVTAGCWEIPRAWFDQLAPSGIIVLPLRLNLATALVAFRRRGDELVSFAAAPCGFMPMEGRSGRRVRRRLGGRGSPMFVHHDYRGPRLNAGRLDALLHTPPRSVTIDGLKKAARFPDSSDFAVFLALQGVPMIGLGGSWEGTYEVGPVDTSKPGLCLFSAASSTRGEAVAYGSDDMAEAVASQLVRWMHVGRPGLQDLRMRVRWTRDRAGEMPQPSDDGTYRFGRGGASFTAWFERR